MDLASPARGISLVSLARTRRDGVAVDAIAVSSTRRGDGIGAILSRTPSTRTRRGVEPGGFAE